VASQYINYLLVLIVKINPTPLSIIARTTGNSLFPIELTKPEVREIAAKMELVTAEKKDSQGLCFIGKVLPEFCNKIRAKEGAIIQIDKDHSIYSTESQQELSSKESLVLASKKRHTPLTWVSWLETSGCPLLYNWTKERSERRRNN
jgi:hypothetical protein